MPDGPSIKPQGDDESEGINVLRIETEINTISLVSLITQKS